MRLRAARILLSLTMATCALSPVRRLCAQNSAGANEHPDSRLDVYGGYAYFHPLNSGINGNQYVDVFNPNATVSVTGWFNHFFGVQMEGGYFSGHNEHVQYFNGANCGASCNQIIYTAQAGPVMRYPLGSFVPFIHALGGGARVNGPAQQPLKWGWGVTGGAGIDYVLPFFKRIAIRPIQADFQYSQVVYGPLVLPAGVKGGFGEIDALKLSGGVVLRLGEKGDKKPVVMECSTAPPVVYPGDLVTATASVADLVDKKKTVYTWATTGGALTPSGTTATIDTTGLAPGDYKVSGHVSQGLKAYEQAGCDAPFTVKAFEPPTLTCSANPSTVISGATSAITALGTSAQNRKLSYSYIASAGQVTGQGTSAILSTAGLSPQQITVTCSVADDLNHTATATATVIVEQPPLPAPVATTSRQLCSLSFERDRKRPVRVDNESKACLDDIALTMNQQPEAKLVIVGNASPDEKPEAAAERSLNVRQYLAQEKGVEPGRIEVRVGDTSGRTVNDTLVPAGAIFNDANTELFDENAIPRTGQAYGVPRATGAAKPARPSRRSRRAHAATPVPAAHATPAYPGADTSAPSAAGTNPTMGADVPDSQIGPAAQPGSAARTGVAPAPPPAGGSTLSQLPNQP